MNELNLSKTEGEFPKSTLGKDLGKVLTDFGLPVGVLNFRKNPCSKATLNLCPRYVDQLVVGDNLFSFLSSFSSVASKYNYKVRLIEESSSTKPTGKRAYSIYPINSGENAQ